LNLVKQEEIEKFLPEAREIMDKIDPKDSIFISCALAHNAGIWSEDNDFLMQNKVKTITQKEIIDFILDNSKKD